MLSYRSYAEPLQGPAANSPRAQGIRKRLPTVWQTPSRFLIPTVLLTVLLFSSCIALPDADQSQAAHAAPQQIQPINTPHQGYRTIAECLDATLSYPPKNRIAAQSLLAGAIDKSIQPNNEGMDVYVGWILKQSWDKDALAFQVPGVPADQQHPTFPPLTGNYMQDAQNKADAIQQWQNNLAANHHFWTQILAQVKTYTNRLRALTPHGDAHGTSILGCISHQSWHLQGGKGEKHLYIASDLEENQFDELVSSASLKGVKVRIIDYYCANAQGCQDKETSWRALFAKLGTTDVQFFDFDQTQLIGNLFS